MKKYKVGIVGQGYVGKALRSGFKSDRIEINTYDKYLSNESSVKNIKELILLSEIIFLCVPTPMKKNGECFTEIVEEVVREIDSFADNRKIVIIKSTVPPGTTDRLNKIYNKVSLVFNPEFLTEANFLADFKNQKYIILGGDKRDLVLISNLYSIVFPEVKMNHTTSINAEIVKYFLNTYLATKVSFANEMKTLCDRVDADYHEIVNLVIQDTRIGKSHLRVPGPDGKLGFGGSCFPKDINALLAFSKSLNIEMSVIEAAIKANLRLRPERDWEKLVNRSVIDE
jgi:nucleotide sugar dehydrogenase